MPTREPVALHQLLYAGALILSPRLDAFVGRHKPYCVSRVADLSAADAVPCLHARHGEADHAGPHTGQCFGGNLLIARPPFAPIRMLVSPLSARAPRGRLLDCRILAPSSARRGERFTWLEVETSAVSVAAVRSALASVLQKWKGSPPRAPHRRWSDPRGCSTGIGCPTPLQFPSPTNT